MEDSQAQRQAASTKTLALYAIGSAVAALLSAFFFMIVIGKSAVFSFFGNPIFIFGTLNAFIQLLALAKQAKPKDN